MFKSATQGRKTESQRPSDGIRRSRRGSNGAVHKTERLRTAQTSQPFQLRVSAFLQRCHLATMETMKETKAESSIRWKVATIPLLIAIAMLTIRTKAMRRTIVGPLLADGVDETAASTSCHVDAVSGVDQEECGGREKACRSLDYAFGPRGAKIVTMSCGTYEINSTLHLTSGMQFVGEPGCETIVSGGKRVPGSWIDNVTWLGIVPDGARRDFFTVTTDGQRTKRANTKTAMLENWDRQNGSWIQWAASDDMVFARLEVRDGLQVVIFESWTAPRYMVTGIDNATRRIWVEPSILKPSGASSSPKGRFFVDGIDALVQDALLPTWSVNQATGELTVIRANNSFDTVVAHQLVELLVIVGSDVVIENVIFEHADVDASCLETLPDHCNLQAASFLETAALRLENCTGITARDVQVRHVGGYAIWVGRSARQVEITRLHAFDLGAGGVRIGAPNHGDAYAEDAAQDVALVDSELSDGGAWYPEGVGVLVQQASRVSIVNNSISRFFYSGISLGWTWDWSPVPISEHIVSGNVVQDIGMHLLSDLGGIYTLGDLRGTLVTNNSVLKVTSYDYPSNHGIYLDQASSGLVFRYNQVADIQCDGLFVHWGINNAFDNNIFAYLNHANNSECAMYGAIRSSIASDPASCNVSRGDTFSCITFNFTRNIVYVNFTDPNQPIIYGQAAYPGSFFDSNVYFNVGDDTLRYPPDNEAFVVWQANFSHDLDSIIADPRFVDPNYGDFSLRPDSPAHQLGIDSL